MTISNTVWGLLVTALLALTPSDRWSAARRMDSEFMSKYGLIVAGGFVLLVLIVLLWWVSARRRATNSETRRGRFSEDAMRRGLTARERQILLAVAARSGLRRNEKIFTTSKAFEQGAAKLLEECVHTRTAAEIEQLRREVTGLREKLGFRRADGKEKQAGISGGPSSRGIPVGRRVALTRLSTRESAVVEGEVVRNDDLELVVELATPVKEGAGAYWRVRYCFDMSVWEFETSSVGSTGARLVLNHSEEVRFVNRRRFARVAVRARARIAPFPFVRSAGAASIVPAAADGGDGNDGIWGLCGGPQFVPATVTEWAGPGLRMSAPFSGRPGDRVLIAFEAACVAASDEGERSASQDRCVVEHIGVVRHCESGGDELSISVEMTGLSDIELEELMRITGSCFADADVSEGHSSAATTAGSYLV